MKYRHEIAQDVIDALTAESTDVFIAQALANYFMCGLRLPARFDINHNAKAALCPIYIDKPGVKRSSATFTDATTARSWIIDALIRAYEVTGMTFRGIETKSIAAVRRRIKSEADMAAYRARQQTHPQSTEDDDIPF